MDRFGIQRFSVTWIVPQPIDFSPTDNIKFTLTFSSFREISFRTGLAQLLGIARVDDLELSIIAGRVLESGAQLVYCQFSGPNAITNAHQLLAMPQSVLRTLFILSRSASPIGPPTAADGGSRTKWVLIGSGCGVAVAAVAICVGCAVRRRRKKRGIATAYRDSAVVPTIARERQARTVSYVDPLMRGVPHPMTWQNARVESL
jgi:hypothetical protein